MPTDMTQRIRAIVTAFLAARDGEPPELGDDDNLLEQGIVDSNEFFDLIMTVESALGRTMDFTEADPADLVSIAGLARHATAQLARA